MIFRDDEQLAYKLRSEGINQKEELKYCLVLSVIIMFLAGSSISSIYQKHIASKSFYTHFFEDVFSLIAYVLILVSCFKINQLTNKHFAARFACISVPITIQLIILNVGLFSIAGFFEPFIQIYYYSTFIFFYAFAYWRYTLTFKIMNS